MAIAIGSHAQVALQPSPASRLWSSHSSPIETVPSPHAGVTSIWPAWPASPATPAAPLPAAPLPAAPLPAAPLPAAPPPAAPLPAAPPFGAAVYAHVWLFSHDGVPEQPAARRPLNVATIKKGARFCME